MLRLTPPPRFAALHLACLVSSALLMGSAPGCGKKDAPAGGDAKSGDPVEATEGTGDTGAAHPATQVGSAARLLTYLEPEATAVLYVRPNEGLRGIDFELFSTLFALPPRGRELVSSSFMLDETLATVLGPDGPPVSDFLGEESLVMKPAVANGNYVLRAMRKTPEEVKTILTARAMEKMEVADTRIEVLAPKGAFPYKVAFLEKDVLAFIPVAEIGSGLTPLTAGRDLPPSEIRRELSQLLESDPSVALLAIVAGPMLHFDLSDDVGLSRLVLRTWQGTGLDAEIRMQTTGEPSVAAKELEEREAPLETDQLQALIKKVAFTVDGPTVAGRLQATKDDLAHIRKSQP